MNPDTFSRRRMLGAAALAAPALALPALPVEVYHIAIWSALCQRSRRPMESLQAATLNKGACRERAMHLIERAIYKVQAGTDFAYQHGGGGY